MHYLMLAVITMPAGATSLQTRKHVFQRLSREPAFRSGSGFFCSPICDWFVIGGGWSGVLTRVRAGQEEPPFDCDTGAELGTEDDAQIIDQMIYDNAIRPYEGTVVDCRYDHYRFVDLDDEPADATRYVGKKWVVVVDYHN
jgi:hypothetical protein